MILARGSVSFEHLEEDTIMIVTHHYPNIISLPSTPAFRSLSRVVLHGYKSRCTYWYTNLVALKWGRPTDHSECRFHSATWADIAIPLSLTNWLYIRHKSCVGYPANTPGGFSSPHCSPIYCPVSRTTIVISIFVSPLSPLLPPSTFPQFDDTWVYLLLSYSHIYWWPCAWFIS